MTIRSISGRDAEIVSEVGEEKCQDFKWKEL
jgi:hypothetical protein